MSESTGRVSLWRRLAPFFSHSQVIAGGGIGRRDISLRTEPNFSDQSISYDELSVSANAQTFNTRVFHAQTFADSVTDKVSDGVVDGVVNGVTGTIPVSLDESLTHESLTHESLTHESLTHESLTHESIATSFRVTTTGRTVGVTVLGDPAGQPVVFLAGIGGCSRLFLGQNRRGLAGYCAQLGFRCYLIDFAHKGVCTRFGSESTFAAGANDEPGVQDLFHWVTEDLPEVVEWVAERHPKQKQHWVGHGAGGLLWWAFWARYPEFRDQCAGMLQVATARATELVNRKTAVGKTLPLIQRWRWGGLNRQWLRRLTAQCRIKHQGFLPFVRWGLAPNDESIAAYEQWLAWCDGDQWVDPIDGFPYCETIKQAAKQPPCSCWVAEYGKLVTEGDVRAFMGLLRLQKPRLFVIREPFDNVSLLTSSEAVSNHFSTMLGWLVETGRTQLDQSQESVLALSERYGYGSER